MYKKSIEKGIAFLESQQRANGCFISYSSSNPDDFSSSKKLHSIFPTALILTCLNHIDDNLQIKKMKKKAASYLLSQRTENWSFNYWERNSKESIRLPYPDDLDDTFCALAALYEFNPKLLDGAALARIISLLTVLEVKEGGPYKTWLVSEDASSVWKDVDIVVNSNIAYFLALQEIELPRLVNFVDTAIKYNKINSPYYNSEIPVIYSISRWYKGQKKKLLIDILLNLKNKHIDNPMLRALIVLALLNFKMPPSKVEADIKYLVSQQRSGAWNPFGFYVDPVMDGKKHYAGSKALTTTFCLLAIEKYNKLLTKSSKQNATDDELTEVVRVQDAVVRRVSRRFIRESSKLKTDAHSIINQTINGAMGSEITALPYLILASRKNTHKTVPIEKIIILGSASLYGWIAYTIYDDFLDGEGEAKMLPIANIALRELTIIFTTVLENNDEFLTFFHQTMDELELANSWEVKTCRINVSGIVRIGDIHVPEYGKYEMLAKRSMGHAIAPTAVLFALGYNRKSPEVKLLLKFFYHYIIARQLNDDAHDFEEDLRHGHINAIAAKALLDLQKKGQELALNIDLLVAKTNEQFWQKNIISIYSDILNHTTKARRALQRNPFFAQTEIFEKKLSSIDILAKKTLEEHKQVKEFLSVYNPEN